MKRRRLSWIFYLISAVVIVAMMMLLVPGDHVDCSVHANAKACSDTHTNSFVGGLIVVAAVVLLGGWAWMRWQQRKRGSR
jgi:hypothetical protein